MINLIDNKYWINIPMSMRTKYPENNVFCLMRAFSWSQSYYIVYLINGSITSIVDDTAISSSNTLNCEYTLHTTPKLKELYISYCTDGTQLFHPFFVSFVEKSAAMLFYYNQ